MATLAARVWNRLDRLRWPKWHTSYAQLGEDKVLAWLLLSLGITRPSYLDIGAFHPSYLSNTYLFYRRGASGVCVEPDPVLCSYYRRQRPRDICLNVGVGPEDGTQAPFFVMTSPALNTFSRDEAEAWQAEGRTTIRKVISVPILSINRIIAENFAGCPNLVSLDVEGMDLACLEAVDFARYRPEVVCVETVNSADERHKKRKVAGIAELMCEKGYFAAADTFINTIFVDKRRWYEPDPAGGAQ